MVVTAQSLTLIHRPRAGGADRRLALVRNTFSHLSLASMPRCPPYRGGTAAPNVVTAYCAVWGGAVKALYGGSTIGCKTLGDTRSLVATYRRTTSRSRRCGPHARPSDETQPHGAGSAGQRSVPPRSHPVARFGGDQHVMKMTRNWTKRRWDRRSTD